MVHASTTSAQPSATIVRFQSASSNSPLPQSLNCIPGIAAAAAL